MLLFSTVDGRASLLELRQLDRGRVLPRPFGSGEDVGVGETVRRERRDQELLELEKAKEELRQRRKSYKKKPLRESVTHEEFSEILQPECIYPAVKVLWFQIFLKFLLQLKKGLLDLVNVLSFDHVQ